MNFAQYVRDLFLLLFISEYCRRSDECDTILTFFVWVAEHVLVILKLLASSHEVARFLRRFLVFYSLHISLDDNIIFNESLIQLDSVLA